MKLETNLRPQDKRTIAIVLYVALVVLFCWYLIRPAWINLGELDDKIMQAEETKQEYRMKTINLASAEVLYDSAVKDITDSTKDFYDIMDNSEIEKMGTTYILRYGLSPLDFSIDLRDGSSFAESPYQYSGLKAPSKSKSKDASANTTATPVPTDTDPKISTPLNTTMKSTDVQSLQVYYNESVNGVDSTIPAEVQCASITIVVQGAKDKCQAIIDDLTKNPSIRVRGFSWRDPAPIYTIDDDGNKTLVNGNSKELKLDLNFYMSDKPKFEDKEG